MASDLTYMQLRSAHRRVSHILDDLKVLMKNSPDTKRKQRNKRKKQVQKQPAPANKMRGQAPENKSR